MLQQKTHYVSIQLGIGGWQPSPAAEVYNKRYGDCKDLTNLMISMLDHAGIKSYPVLVKTRSSGLVYPEFPAEQFNHVITCVPLPRDTVWLECTADYITAGALPYNTEGCNVLLVTGNGGVIIKTPQSSAARNRWQSFITGRIQSNNNFNFKGTLALTGNYNYHYNYLRHEQSSKDVEDRFARRFGRYAPNPTFTEIRFPGKDRLIADTLYIEVGGEFSSFITQTRRRLFVNPNVLNRVDNALLPDAESRNFPLFFDYSFTQIDSLEIYFPGVAFLEAAPEPLLIETEFGRYRTDYRFIDKKLFYTREFKIKWREIPEAYYAEYLDFIRKVIQNDKHKFVIKKM
jgi:hypothetical protein